MTPHTVMNVVLKRGATRPEAEMLRIDDPLEMLCSISQPVVTP